MILRKFLVAAAISAALTLPLAAPATAQATLRAGTTVMDTQGGQVGTITAVDGEFVTLRTDRHEARVPASSLTATDNGALFGMTRDQLNAQIDQAMAQAQQAVAVGAIVHDRNGAVVGPIETVDEQNVTVKLGEHRFQLPRTAVAQGQNGLVIGATLADIQAQLDSASGGN